MGDFVTLWIGERLGAVERACLKSMVRHGRGVKLFCYAEPANVPDGVTLRDASSIIALDRLKSKCGDRSDLYSDWFRYLLLRNDEGTWLDTDVYVLKEIDEGRPYLFGKQQFPDSINGAVLRLPAQSPILSQLIDQFEGEKVPRWQPLRYVLPMKLEQLVTGKVDLKRARWGTTGPFALTALVPEHGLEEWVEQRERFYPVGWKQAAWILDPAIGMDDVTTPKTVAIHLWNECIRTFKNDPAPEGSFLAKLQEEGSH